MLWLAIALAVCVSPDEAQMCLQRQPDETAQYISSLKPEIDRRYARRLGRLIDYWAGRFDLDPDLLVAIIRAESYFEPDTMVCWPAPWKGKDETTCDHGLAQINEVWVDEWKLDSFRLVHDDAYNIMVAARLLARLKKAHGDEPDWYGRYHSDTPRRKAAYLSKLEAWGYVLR
jgi:hypothetical protein